jgi:hypothetical protein
MRTLNCGRYAMGICAAISILAGCSGGAGGVSAPQVTNVGNDASHRQKFLFTGTEQTFTVPAGVTKVRVDAKGASGGGASGSQGSKVTAGRGGEVKATIPVAAGERLAIFVGGAGVDGGSGGSGGSGGYNGGAPGGAESYGGEGAGGGGASDVRQGGVKLSHRVLIAGGGGGAGGTHYGFYEGGGSGGLGGGAIGGDGGNPCYASYCYGCGGSGGTQSAGGIGGNGGNGESSSYHGAKGGAGNRRSGGSGGSSGRYGGSGGGGAHERHLRRWWWRRRIFARGATRDRRHQQAGSAPRQRVDRDFLVEKDRPGEAQSTASNGERPLICLLRFVSPEMQHYVEQERGTDSKEQHSIARLRRAHHPPLRR